MEIQEVPKTEYVSYNGLGRSPVIWGIPYMVMLFVGSFGLLFGMLCGLKFGPLGWLFGLIVVPILIFIKMISATDDKAIDILMIELKWAIRKFFRGNSEYYGGTLTITPTTYGRKIKNVKRYFEKTIKRGR